MRFSESSDYLAYIDARARGDLSAALRALRDCLKEKEFTLNPTQHAYLLQTIGDVHFQQGDQDLARTSYQRAEVIDPRSLLFKYNFALFLAEKIADRNEALTKCN